jgi:hypothetical protein
MDNGEEICKLNNAHLWYAFANTIGDNETMKYINHALTKNSNNYEMSADEDGAKIKKAEYGLVPNTESDVGKCYVSLRKLLPFFASVGEQKLPFDLMKKPQLVIEYNQNLDWVFTTGALPTAITITEPFLCVDVLEDEVSAKDMVLNFVSYENDRLVVPATNTDVKTQVKERYGAFKNKVINKMIILNNVNTPYLATTTTTSLAQRAEKIQLNINGVQHLAYQGVISNCEKAVMCDETWGARNIGTHQYGLGFIKTDDIIEADVKLDASAYSVFGCDVNKRIDTLELEYERVGDGSDYNKEILLQAFCEVPKEVVLSRGNVAIVAY